MCRKTEREQKKKNRVRIFRQATGGSHSRVCPNGVRNRARDATPANLQRVVTGAEGGCGVESGDRPKTMAFTQTPKNVDRCPVWLPRV